MKFLTCRWLLALFALVATLTSSAFAQTDFPTRTVRIVVGFQPGGTTDILARVIAEKLREIWNVPVVVENRPGADGIIATTMVHQAPPDGYTLLMSTNALTITPHMKSLPYDPIKDFEPVTIVGQEYHHMMVTPALPAKTVKEFIDLAKSKPDALSFASAGPGSAPFLGMQRFMQAAGIPSMVHVPFPGSMPGLLSLVSGDVQAMFSSPSTSLQIALDGKVRILGVAGPKRDKNVPNIPDARRVRPDRLPERHLVRADDVLEVAEGRAGKDPRRTLSARCALPTCRSGSSMPARRPSATVRKNSAR